MEEVSSVNAARKYLFFNKRKTFSKLPLNADALCLALFACIESCFSGYMPTCPSTVLKIQMEI
jgi:hypothetical protein